MAKQKYKRSKLIIYPEVQYPILGWALAFGVICSLFTAVFMSAYLGGGYSPKNAKLLLILGVFAIFIYAYLLAFFTNRLFGPLFRLHTAIRKLANGEKIEPIHLRPGDRFTNIADDFNRMVNRLSKK